MHAFTVHPQKNPAPTADAKPRRWRRRVAALVLLLGIAGLVWAVRPDPHLARAKELQSELFTPEAKNLPPDERKAKFAELRDQMKRLTDDQKRDLFAPMREKQKAEMARYIGLPPKEKVKYLDERIDRSEKMRKEREQKGGKGNGAGGPPGGFPGGGSAAGSKAGGFAGSVGAGGPGGGGGPGQGRSPAEIENRRKQFLDNTTPEERAQMDQFRKDMNDRRKQRGLPVTTR
ncbi:MAG: hypothetical protein JWO38_2719 [Gemmataceae bacterium]|nr:hypothetical protein [Gemmataceae bacterium]